jgi:hypothetical protein
VDGVVILKATPLVHLRLILLDQYLCLISFGVIDSCRVVGESLYQ